MPLENREEGRVIDLMLKNLDNLEYMNFKVIIRHSDISYYSLAWHTIEL